MRANRLKTILEGRGAVLNGWLHIPSAVSAEGMAHAGFDALTVDLQHGPIGFEAALAMLQAISTTETVPLARAPWNEPGAIMKLLDAGAYGIICPMVNTRADAERFVGACRYPPSGYRSYGPTRVRFYAGQDYAAHANEAILTLAMIETAEALDNLEAIVSVPGLDGVYVGPADLSQSLGGQPGADFEDGPVAEALGSIVEAAARQGLVAGIHTLSAAYAKGMVARGFRFVTVQSDLSFMTRGAQEVTASMRPGPDVAATPPKPY